MGRAAVWYLRGGIGHLSQPGVPFFVPFGDYELISG